ncbi:MAG: AMP-binding protein [Clostridiales bacterium]|nr:AMP-binding protein [Clostridiales bacterium]
MAFVPTTELHDYTLHGLLKRNAERLPDNDSIVAPEFDVCWSWAELDRRTDVIARGFYAMGLRKGDHVAIWSTNTPEWILTQFAASKIGAVLVTVNTNYKQFELNYQLNQSDTKMLIMTKGIKDNDYISHITTLVPTLATETGEINCKQLPCLKRVFIIDEVDNKPMGIQNFSELYQAAETVPQSTIDEITASVNTHDTINMQYTSGTTGFPKGVMLTHYNIGNNGQFMGDCMKFTENDRLLIVVPMFHCFGVILGMMSCLTHCTTIVLMDHYNPIREMEILVKTRCTAVHGVPTMFIGMLEHPDFDKFDFSLLRTGIMAGSPCPIKTMQDVTGKMHLSELVITYGQTECSPGMTMSRTDDSLELRCTTVGRLLPQTEGKIIDAETGEELPVNTPGEIITRGYHLMKGYYKMPEATRAAIDEDGWLHTGDIGTVDEDGNFRITGRLKDMIIRGGENIYPRELEEFLYTHPQVRDVQVVGLPDEKYGEEVCACVILREGAVATETELIEFVKKGLSKFKAPRYVILMDEFPMTASGKIQKFKLRETGIDVLNLQTAANIETA